MARCLPEWARSGSRSIRDVPQHTARIRNVQHPQAPRLQLWRLCHVELVFLLEPLGGDSPPPGVTIFDVELHHEILCKLLVIEVLEQETKSADLEFRNLFVVPLLDKSQVGVKPARGREILRRKEGLEITDRDIHWNSYARKNDRRIMSRPLPDAFESCRTTVRIRVPHAPYQACLPGAKVARRGNRLVHVDVTTFNRVAMEPSSLALKVLDVALCNALIIA